MSKITIENRYKIAGLIILISGLLINPWFASWVAGFPFSDTVFFSLIILSFVLVFSGLGVILYKKRFFSWILEKYHDFAVIVLNIMILLGLLNVFASLMMKKPADQNPDISYFHSPQDLFTDSIEFIRNIYPGKSDRDIKELLLLTSPYANHPVLEFQERVQESEFYNVGFEGIRFDKKVTRQNAVQKINGSVWVMGGSTTFGQGVTDNETISAYLNQLDTSNTYLNFGVHAYHQSNEINKLILLLKKGYLPKKVIFIDGLNDLIRMIETNFHPLETPALAKSAYASDYNISTRETGNSFLEQLPVTRWVRSFIDENNDNVILPESPRDEYDNVYDPGNLYNTDPKLHFMTTILRSPYKTIDSTGLVFIVGKLKDFYRSNYYFIGKLAQAYGFEFSIYYQPQGILSEGNPFWRNQAERKQTPLYRNFEYIIPRIRNQLSIWNYPEFFDISDSQDTCPSCYVDLTHYNHVLNHNIARAILNNEMRLERIKQ